MNKFWEMIGQRECIIAEMGQALQFMQDKIAELQTRVTELEAENGRLQSATQQHSISDGPLEFEGQRCRRDYAMPERPNKYPDRGDEVGESR